MTASRRQSGTPTTIGATPETEPTLVILTSSMTFPAGDSPHNDCAYATALRVVWDADGEGDSLYVAEPSGMTLRVFFPTIGVDADGAYDEAETFLDGDMLWAAFNPRSGRLEAITEDRPTLKYGKLDGALVAGGSATVSIYSDATTDSGVNVTAYAPPEMTGAFPSAGQWVWIEWRKDRWYVRWHRHARKGTLYSALTNATYTTTTLDTGESVTTYAYALPDGVTLPAGTKVIVEPLLDNTWQVIQHDSVSFTVVGKTDASLSYDNTTGVTVSIWRRNASTNAKEDSGVDIANVLPPAELGSGLIPAGAWVEVLVSGGKATIVEFPRWHWGTLGSTLSSGNSASVVLPSEAGVITSFDNLLPSGKSIESGAKVKIALNNSDGKWYVVMWYNAATLPNGTTTGDILKWDGDSWEPAAPVTLNVITSLQFSSGKLQYKDTEITVIAKGTEYAGWKDAGGQTDLATQTVLTDFQVDATDKLIQVKSRSLYVRPAAAESSWTTKHTGTECE
jgi:hypothetical protein